VTVAKTGYSQAESMSVQVPLTETIRVCKRRSKNRPHYAAIAA